MLSQRVWRFRCIKTLPSNPRTIANSRQFHASKPNHLVAEALETSHQLFISAHDISGLPWGATICMVAALTRLAYLPIQYYITKQFYKRNMVNPLLATWRKEYQTRAAAVFPTRKEGAAQASEKYVQARMKEKASELYHKFKIRPGWQTFALAIGFLPIWIVNADVIRRMSGSEKTLLDYFTGSSQQLSDTVPVQPAFATEPFLWLPDLVQADPLWLCPLVYGAVFMFHIRFNSVADVPKLQEAVASAPPGWGRITATVSLQINQLMPWLPPWFTYLLIANDAPSALVLYFVGSVATQAVMVPSLKKFIGVKKGAEPARRRQVVMKNK